MVRIWFVVFGYAMTLFATQGRHVVDLNRNSQSTARYRCNVPVHAYGLCAITTPIGILSGRGCWVRLLLLSIEIYPVWTRQRGTEATEQVSGSRTGHRFFILWVGKSGSAFPGSRQKLEPTEEPSQ